MYVRVCVCVCETEGFAFPGSLDRLAQSSWKRGVRVSLAVVWAVSRRSGRAYLCLCFGWRLKRA